MSKSIGTRIKDLRKENHLTQKEFAKILNIQNTTLSQYENGINTPSDEIKVMIADYFKISLDYLFCRTEIRNNNINLPNNVLSTEGLDKKDVELIKQVMSHIRSKNE